MWHVSHLSSSALWRTLLNWETLCLLVWYKRYIKPTLSSEGLHRRFITIICAQQPSQPASRSVLTLKEDVKRFVFLFKDHSIPNRHLVSCRGKKCTAELWAARSVSILWKKEGEHSATFISASPVKITVPLLNWIDIISEPLTDSSSLFSHTSTDVQLFVHASVFTVIVSFSSRTHSRRRRRCRRSESDSSGSQSEDRWVYLIRLRCLSSSRSRHCDDW